VPSTATAQTVRPPASRVMTTLQTTTWRVIGEVEITDGNIAHNHIYPRSFFDHFPAHTIAVSHNTTPATLHTSIMWVCSATRQPALTRPAFCFNPRCLRAP